MSRHCCAMTAENCSRPFFCEHQHSSVEDIAPTRKERWGGRLAKENGKPAGGRARGKAKNHAKACYTRSRCSCPAYPSRHAPYARTPPVPPAGRARPAGCAHAPCGPGRELRGAVPCERVHGLERSAHSPCRPARPSSAGRPANARCARVEPREGAARRCPTFSAIFSKLSVCSL